MKKTLISALCILSIVACKKKESNTETPSADHTAPVISRKGNEKDTVAVLSNYVDAGATATDDTDGDITSKITVTGNVNTALPGNTFTLTYNVSDQAGNPAKPVSRFVYVRPAPTYILAGKYNVACSSSTVNPGVDPIVTAANNYTSSVVLSGQSNTSVQMSALNIGPVTGGVGNLTVNGFTFSAQSSPINAPAQTFAFCTGTISPTKTSFTIDTKYYQTDYPNKYYEARNIFTKQ